MKSGLSQSVVQTTVLAPQLRQGLKFLAMNLPELRRELIADRERPVIRPRVVKDAAEQRRQMVHDNLASAHKTDSYDILWPCSPVGEDT